MADVFIKYNDGTSETIKNVNGVGFEGSKLLVIKDQAESQIEGVMKFKFDYSDLDSGLMDSNDITQD